MLRPALSLRRLLFTGLPLLAGCQAPPLYHWGTYPNLIYATYRAPDKATPEVQIERLEKDVQYAKAKGLTPAPGMQAQLGYAYLEAGRPEEARARFEAEKATFPESAAFMDHLISRLPAP